MFCFRNKAGDDFNMKLMNVMNATGKAYFTHTKLNGQVVLRMSIRQINNEKKHLKATWSLIRETSQKL